MLVVTVIPSLLVLYRLNTKGTSKKLKSTILYRNSFFLITYLTLQFIFDMYVFCCQFKLQFKLESQDRAFEQFLRHHIDSYY